MRVSKAEVIAKMSDRARAMAKEFERSMSLKSVEINGVKWVRVKK